MRSVQNDYFNIIKDYVSGKKTVEDFKNEYIKMYLDEKRACDDALFNILDNLYAAVDLCTDDEELLNNFDFYMTQDELLETAKGALKDILSLKSDRK